MLYLYTWIVLAVVTSLEVSGDQRVPAPQTNQTCNNVVYNVQSLQQVIFIIYKIRVYTVT